MKHYAVFNMRKPKGGINSLGLHIERRHHPDNARAELSHLNRYDIVKLPPGCKTIAEAVEYRIAHAGLARKVGKNQVRCLTAVMSSDHDKMEELIKEGKFEGWLNDSVRWAQDKFGRENVVGAVLHMDETTPHLHIVIVPIVTTERERAAREAKVKKRYRTKPKGTARLCANEIATPENLTLCQDEYAQAVNKYGLERGERGSLARHVDQQEYYRNLQRNKKELESEVAELTTEKKKVSREKKSLEASKDKIQQETNLLIGKNEIYKSANDRLSKENETLVEENNMLVTANNSLVPKVTELVEQHDELEQSNAKLADDIARLEMQKMRKVQTVQDADLVKYKADIERYFPDVSDLLFWGRYCTSIGFPDSYVQRILNFEKIGFRGQLYSHEHQQSFRTEGSWAKLERSAENKHTFELKIDGVSVFQWFKDMARKLLEKMGFRQPQPKQGKGLHH